MRGVGMIGQHLVVTTLQDARSVVKVYDLDGQFVRDVSLPGIGTAYGFGGRNDQNDTLLQFHRRSPRTIYTYDVSTGDSQLAGSKVRLTLNHSSHLNRCFYSKDNKVPML